MNFLATLLEDGVPPKKLKNEYSGMFASVANNYHGNFNVVRQRGKFKQIQKASERLAKACAKDPELKALFGWKHGIYSYYEIRDKDKNSRPPIAELKALLAINPDYVATVVDDATGGFNWGYQKGVDQKPMHEMKAILQQALAKASPFVQVLYCRYLDPKNTKDVAGKDKAFMASLKKPDLKKSIALIGNTDPNKVSFLRYALESQRWPAKDKRENWNNLEVGRIRAIDARGWKTKHPLRAALKARVEKDLARGKVDPYIVTAWYNSMGRKHDSSNHTTPEDATLMMKIAASPAYNKLTLIQKPMVEHRLRAAIVAQDKKKLAPKLEALTKDSKPAQVVAALKEAIANYKAATHLHGISGVTQITALHKEVLQSLRYLKHALAFL